MACFCCGGTADVALPKDEGDRLNHYGLVRCPPPKLRRKEIAVPVKLNVYSLTDTNKKLTKVGMGVFHTGVVVYGVEWGYGESVGNPNASGLFYTSPGMAAGALHRTITVGHTTKSPSQVDTILHRLENEWKSADYHILSNNCNHFAQELLNLLSTREKLRVPSWCNRAARFTNVVIPRKMATMVQRKLGGTPAATTDTSGKHGSTSMPKSIIPAYWYRHPDVYQPPRYTATDAPQVVHLQNIHVQQPSVPSRRLRQKTASQMNEMNGEDGLEPYRTDQGSASREMDATAPPRHPPAAPASRRKYLSDTPLDHEMAESMELFSSRECEDAERMEADDDASMRPHAAMSHGPAMTIYLSTQGSAYSPLAGDSDAPDMMMGRHRSTAAAAMDGDGVVFDEADFLFGLQQPPFVEMEDEMPLVASQTPVVVGPSADPTSQQHAAAAPLTPPTPAEEVPELPSSSTNTATNTEHSKHRRVRRRKHVLPDAAPDTAHSRRSATSTEEVPPPAELVEEAKPAAPPPKMLKKVHAAPPPASARSAVAAKKAKTHHRASPDQQAFSDPMASAVDAPRSTASPPTSAQDCGSSDSPHLNHTAPATTPEKKKVLRKKEKAKVGVPAKTSSRQAATTPPQQETQHQHTQPSVDGVRPAALQLPLPTSVESGAALELCFSGSIATPVEAAGLPIDANNAQRCIPLPPIPDAHHHASPMTSSPTSVRSPRHASSLSADAISAAANSLADDVPSPHPRHHQPVCGEAGRRGGASRSTRRNSTGSCTNSQRSSSAPPRSMSVQTLTHRSPSRPPSVPRGKMEVNVAHRGPQTARARINTTSSTRGARSASASARTLAKRPATSLAATAERRGRKTPMSVRPSSATSTH